MRSTDCDWETFDLKECERDMFVCTINGAIHDLFYNLLKNNNYIIQMFVQKIIKLFNLTSEV